MKEILEQLEDYKNWEKVNDDFTSLHYIGAVCNFSHITTISRLFFPEIVIVSDCVFLKDSRQKPYFKGWWEKALTIPDLEKIINFICIGDLTNLESEQNNEVLNEKIAIFLKDVWQHYFEIAYKNINVEVKIYNHEFDGWCITVFQKDKLNYPKPEILPEW
jgi:hypothetical protein